MVVFFQLNRRGALSVYHIPSYPCYSFISLGMNQIKLCEQIWSSSRLCLELIPNVRATHLIHVHLAFEALHLIYELVLAFSKCYLSSLQHSPSRVPRWLPLDMLFRSANPPLNTWFMVVLVEARIPSTIIASRFRFLLRPILLH